MTSKEALENIRDFKPFGYDTTNKEEYVLSGTLNDYLQEELDILENDLEVLEILLKYDVLSVIGIDEDKEKIKWYIATHKKLDL